jgi:hypothetical protein
MICYLRLLTVFRATAAVFRTCHCRVGTVPLNQRPWWDWSRLTGEEVDCLVVAAAFGSFVMGEESLADALASWVCHFRRPR